MTINASSTSQFSTKQYIFTNVSACKIFIYVPIFQFKSSIKNKAGTLLYTSRLGSGCQNIAKLIIASSDASPKIIWTHDFTV